MNCNDAQEAVLRALEEGPKAAASADLVAHIARCAACTRFQATHLALDRRLAALLPPPHLTSDFRVRVRQNIARERARRWSAAAPDVVHYAACAVATLVCAAVLPFEASLTIGAGAAVTVVTHLLLDAVRQMLERADGNV